MQLQTQCRIFIMVGAGCHLYREEIVRVIILRWVANVEEDMEATAVLPRR